MKDNLKFTLLAIGIIVIFFIMGREIMETRAKLRDTQNLVAQQKKEKAWLQDELRATRGNLVTTGKKLRTCQGKLDFVNKKISVLKASNASLTGRNAALIIARQGLEREVGALREEKRIMEAKFHSLKELKKAIREVKLEIRKEKINQQKEADKWETANGNRGFFTKDGECFYKPKVNVDVRPASLSLDKK
jgi:hypothetical protein